MAERARILVVDDDESVRRVLKAVLADSGYSVDTAKSTGEAVRKSKTKFYNVALIDIRLPDLKGTKLLTRIKDTTPRMRKIVITGYPSLQNAIDALNRGADAYILKPFNMEEVLNTVKRQLEEQRKEEKYSQEKVKEFIETRIRQLDEKAAEVGSG